MGPVSLKFQQNDVLPCEIPHIIASVSSSIETLSITPGPSYSRLMTELNLHPERWCELLYKDIILEKPYSQRDAKVDPTQKVMHPSIKKPDSKKLHQEQSYSFKTFMSHSRKNL